MSDLDNDVIVSSASMPSDNDQALRLVETFGHRLRYCEGIGWLVWSGHYWESSKSSAVALARRVARKRSLEAVSAGNRDVIAQALAMESAGHITGCLKLAESDARVHVKVEDLDADDWLLCVTNGTIDLRTGIIRDHRSEDLITKMAPVVYDPQAQHIAFDSFLATVEAGSAGMSDFLARCLGMALTGDASAESLTLLQGYAGAGKTTLTDAVSEMLGDYSVKLPISSFMLSKHGRAAGAASPDLVRLRGSRFAFAAESDSAARLDAGVVKNLTGGEKTTARDLYSEQITFRQTWKIWIVSNYDPKCDSDDTGLWRRIIKVVFPPVPTEKRDPGIKRSMFSDPVCRSAILAWAVRGCLAWQVAGGGRIGLQMTSDVIAGTDAYREAQDPLTMWLAESGLSFSSSSQMPIADVRLSYEEWCRESGFTPVLGRRFNLWLEGRNCTRGQMKIYGITTKVWFGITDKSRPVTKVTTIPITLNSYTENKVIGNPVTLVTGPMTSGVIL